VRRLVLVAPGRAAGEGIGARPAWVAELFTRHVPAAGRHVAADPVRADPDQPGGRARLHRAHRRPRRPRHPGLEQFHRRPARGDRRVRRRQDPSYAHLKGLELPVLVVNGSDDIVIPTINSYILQQFFPTPSSSCTRTPATARISQYPGLFVRHARIFLDD